MMDESYLKTLEHDLIRKLQFHFDFGVFIFHLVCHLDASLCKMMAVSLWLTLGKKRSKTVSFQSLFGLQGFDSSKYFKYRVISKRFN